MLSHLKTKEEDTWTLASAPSHDAHLCIPSVTESTIKLARMILLETDAPYFLPRGAKWNYKNTSFPGQVIFVAKAISKLKKMSLAEVLFRNIENSKNIYKRFFEQNSM